jgi:hypothetical protein
MVNGKWKMENGKCPANGMRLWRSKWKMGMNERRFINNLQLIG